MRIRHVSAPQKIELQMTPMIDIVFQLLVFFVMTFKIAAMEGDFNIKMPAAAPSQGMPDEPTSTHDLTVDGECRGRISRESN